MKFLLIILLLIIFPSSILISQIPDTIWTKVFVNEQDDIGYDVEQTSDGGFIMVGETKSFGLDDIDIYVILTNEEGDTIWTRAYGGNNLDIGRAIVQSEGGDFIIAGYTISNGNFDADVYLLKLNNNGEIIWSKTYGGNDDDYGMDIQKTNDEGFIITGFTQSFGNGVNDIYLIKADSDGDTLWTKTYGGASSDLGFSVKQLSNGGYIIGGYAFPETLQVLYDFYLLKVDENGNKLWERTYGGEFSDFGFEVVETFDGNYVIVGETRSYGLGFNDIYIIKVDTNGDTLWTKNYGGNGYDYAYSLDETIDRGLVITGITEGTNEVEGGLYVLKVDSCGIKLWEKSIRFGNLGGGRVFNKADRRGRNNHYWKDTCWK